MSQGDSNTLRCWAGLCSCRLRCGAGAILSGLGLDCDQRRPSCSMLWGPLHKDIVFGVLPCSLLLVLCGVVGTASLLPPQQLAQQQCRSSVFGVMPCSLLLLLCGEGGTASLLPPQQQRPSPHFKRHTQSRHCLFQPQPLWQQQQQQPSMAAVRPQPTPKSQHPNK